MPVFDYTSGTLPIILSIPHAGTEVPGHIVEHMTDKAKLIPDTDWHVHRLFEFAKDSGIHIIKARYSRYVVDLNRDPEDHSLYPGQFTTGLCPVNLFDGSAIYKPDAAPNASEIRERVRDYWKPYHAKLDELISSSLFQHGCAVLFDAHSIASQVPNLFEGTLPELNLGTNDGRSCCLALHDALSYVCEKSPYTHVVNGRFKGGYITRHYGNPLRNVQAMQLEISQSTYMENYPSFAYDEVRAKKLEKTLEQFLKTLRQWVK